MFDILLVPMHPEYSRAHIRCYVVCKSGLTFSAQASETHYCTPRDNYGPYTAIEIGYPSRIVEDFLPYADDPDKIGSTVYGYVPVEVVDKVINDNGGIER